MGRILSQEAVSIIARPGEVVRLNNQWCVLIWSILVGSTGHFVVDKDTDTAREAKEQEENKEEQAKAGAEEIQEEIDQITFFLFCHSKTI